MWEKYLVALERKVVLILVWESQETHVRHRHDYDRSCLSGVKPQYNQPIMIILNIIALTSQGDSSLS